MKHKKPLNMWTFCDEGCYTDLKHGRCWIDPEDWPTVKLERWISEKTRRNYYVRSSKVKKVYLHRLILNLQETKLHTDHINHDGLDNRKKNLSVGSCSDNIFNQRLSVRNTSGFVGVSKTKDNKYAAQIKYRGKVFSTRFVDFYHAIFWRIMMEELLTGKSFPINQKTTLFQ